jgi:hypothetical protein
MYYGFSVWIPILSSSSPPLQDTSTDDTPESRLVVNSYSTIERKSPAYLHVQMYAIGDKYDIRGLRKLAKHNFDSDIVVHWEQETFIPIIELVYGTDGPGDGGLRDMVCEVAL